MLIFIFSLDPAQLSEDCADFDVSWGKTSVPLVHVVECVHAPLHLLEYAMDHGATEAVLAGLPRIMQEASRVPTKHPISSLDLIVLDGAPYAVFIYYQGHGVIVFISLNPNPAPSTDASMEEEDIFPHDFAIRCSRPENLPEGTVRSFYLRSFRWQLNVHR